MSSIEFWLIFALGGCLGLSVGAGVGALILLKAAKPTASEGFGNANGRKLNDGHYYRVEPHPEYDWCTVLVIGAWKWEMEERRIEFGLSDAQSLWLKVKKVWGQRKEAVDASRSKT